MSEEKEEVLDEKLDDGAEDEESSLRDTLESAFEDDDGDSEVDESDAEKVAAKPDSESTDDSDKEKDALGEDGDKVADAKSDGDEKDTGKPLKAPVGWGPKEREAWSKVPANVQQQIHSREREIATAMQGTADARVTHDEFEKLAQSFAPIMAAEGVQNPMQAVKGLFNTVAELRMGSPEQKAVKMAAMIQHYGIDINALDSALVGQTPTASPNAEMEHMINQRMGPVNDLLSELQTRQGQAQQQTIDQANHAVASFEGEFLSDVRNDMADLIDMAAARGQEMTLQNAYDKAVLLKPDIQEILTKRASDEKLFGNRQNIGKKLNAASSISGRQGGDGKGGGAMSIRGSIEDAWEASAEKI